MKVLNKGDVSIGKWWIGIELVCHECGRKIELEENDDYHALFVPCSSAGEVKFQCETCGNMMIGFKSDISEKEKPASDSNRHNLDYIAH